MRHILFVDDEPQQGEIRAIKSYMDYYVLELRESKLYEVTVAKGPDEALKCLKQKEFSMAILDSMMPEGKELSSSGLDTGHAIFTGVALSRVIHEDYPNLPIFLLSSLEPRKSAFGQVLDDKIVKRVIYKLNNTPKDLLRIVYEGLESTKEAKP